MAPHATDDGNNMSSQAPMTNGETPSSKALSVRTTHFVAIWHGLRAVAGFRQPGNRNLLGPFCEPSYSMEPTPRELSEELPWKPTRLKL
jgi:hypothetical protein